jgi:hypothetical protein
MLLPPNRGQSGKKGDAMQENESGEEVFSV